MMCFRHVLFLPAAFSNMVYYWSFVGSSGVTARVVNGGKGWFVRASSHDRSGIKAIRLASRQGCLVVRLVVLSLLFLPAAAGGAATYWSPLAVVLEGVWHARAFAFQRSYVGRPTDRRCENRYAIRLASRENCQL